MCAPTNWIPFEAAVASSPHTRQPVFAVTYALIPSTPRGTPALLVFVFGFIMAACHQRAEASCGDYLHMGNVHETSSSGSGQTDAVDIRLRGELPIEDGRCHGPGCSQSPETPSNASDAPKPHRIKTFAHQVHDGVDETGLQLDYSACAENSYAFGYLSDILRPPRSLSGCC